MIFEFEVLHMIEFRLIDSSVSLLAVYTVDGITCGGFTSAPRHLDGDGRQDAYFS